MSDTKKADKPKSAIARVTPVAKKKLEIRGRMLPGTLKIADEIERLGNVSATSLMSIQYNIGTMIVDATESTDPEEYEQNAVENLAELTEMSPSWLYRLRDLVKTWTAEEIKTWTAQPMSNGGHMSVKHWMCLRKLQSKENAVKLIRKTLDESWTANQLDEHISSGAAGKMKTIRTGGRLPSAPTSPLAGLSKFISLGIQFNNYEDLAEASVFSAIDELAEDSVTDNLQAKLSQAKEIVDAGLKRLAAAKDRIEKNLGRVTDVLATKGEQESAEKAEKEPKEAKPEKAAKPAAKPAKPAKEGKPAKAKGKKAKKGNKPKRPVPATV